MTLYDLDELVRAANVQHVPTSLKLLLKEAVPMEPDALPDEVIQAGADALEIWSEQDFSEPAVRWSATVEVLAALLGAGIGDNDET